MYKSVEELRREELDELKNNYYWQLYDQGGLVAGISDSSEIPDNVILEHYAGVSFVEEDFFCNIKD